MSLVHFEASRVAARKPDGLVECMLPSMRIALKVNAQNLPVEPTQSLIGLPSRATASFPITGVAPLRGYSVSVLVSER